MWPHAVVNVARRALPPQFPLAPSSLFLPFPPLSMALLQKALFFSSYPFFSFPDPGGVCGGMHGKNSGLKRLHSEEGKATKSTKEEIISRSRWLLHLTLSSPVRPAAALSALLITVPPTREANEKIARSLPHEKRFAEGCRNGQLFAWNFSAERKRRRKALNLKKSVAK